MDMDRAAFAVPFPASSAEGSRRRREVGPIVRPGGSSAAAGCGAVPVAVDLVWMRACAHHAKSIGFRSRCAGENHSLILYCTDTPCFAIAHARIIVASLWAPSLARLPCKLYRGYSGPACAAAVPHGQRFFTRPVTFRRGPTVPVRIDFALVLFHVRMIGARITRALVSPRQGPCAICTAGAV